jgi:hypothetical protein
MTNNSKESSIEGVLVAVVMESTYHFGYPTAYGLGARYLIPGSGNRFFSSP